MKIELLKEKHYDHKPNPDYDEELYPGIDNPVYVTDYDKVTFTRFVGLKADGMELQVLGGSDIILQAGPDPSYVTVTLIFSEFDTIDGHIVGGEWVADE